MSEVDAMNELADQERGASSLEQRPPAQSGFRLFFIVILLIAVCFGGVLTYKAWEKSQEINDGEKKQVEVKQQLRPLSLAPIEVPQKEPEPKVFAPVKQEVVKREPIPIQPVYEKVVVKNAEPAEPTKEELIHQRRLSSSMNGGNVETSGSGGEASDETGNDSLLAKDLQPFKLKGSKASYLGDRNLIITGGTMLDCVLHTRLVTTVRGQAVCYLVSDVYSANGLVKLLDAQSKVLGNYQGTLSQGQARIGVYWNTIETPNGVTISLDSGGTGPLGAAGVSGYVDTHFWERFGGAILLSTVDDFAAALAGKDDNNTSRLENTTSAAQQMAAEALKNTINIPPTLYKNQGDRVGILVSRTLSFEDVYELEYVGE